MANTFFMPVSYVKANSYLDDNIDEKTIKIAMLDMQDQMLEPVLGTVLFDKLKTDIKNNTLVEPYVTLLTDKIYPFMLQGIIYKIYLNLIYRLTNSSIVKDSNTVSTAISISELNVLKQEREVGMKYHQEKLKLYLDNNTSTFPEYTQTDVTGVTHEESTQPINFYSSEGDESTVDYLRRTGWPEF
jgi:hypothetical protein